MACLLEECFRSFGKQKGGYQLFENLNDKDLIESYEQSIEQNLDKVFIHFLGMAIRERGLEEFVKIKPKQLNHSIQAKRQKQMVNT